MVNSRNIAGERRRRSASKSVSSCLVDGCSIIYAATVSVDGAITPDVTDWESFSFHLHYLVCGSKRSATTKGCLRLVFTSCVLRDGSVMLDLTNGWLLLLAGYNCETVEPTLWRGEGEGVTKKVCRSVWFCHLNLLYHNISLDQDLIGEYLGYETAYQNSNLHEHGEIYYFKNRRKLLFQFWRAMHSVSWPWYM